MNKVKAKAATRDNVAPYGQIASFLEPDGYSLNGAIHCFYPDRVTVYDSGIGAASLSPIAVKKPEKMVIEQMEMHFEADEVILPLDDDAIIHVAPPTGEPDTDNAEAFIVKKGSAIRLKRGVWHLCPLPVHNEVLHAVIILPERTYAEDCHVVDLEKPFEIEL